MNTGSIIMLVGLGLIVLSIIQWNPIMSIVGFVTLFVGFLNYHITK